jgi:hypothetical protein
MEIRKDLRKRLIEIARSHCVITYGDLAQEFNIPCHPIGRIRGREIFDIGNTVGDISIYEHSKGRPYLSAIVVNQETGEVSGGFFGLPGIPPELKRDWGEHTTYPLSDADRTYARQKREEVWAFSYTDEILNETRPE